MEMVMTIMVTIMMTAIILIYTDNDYTGDHYRD